LPSLTTGRARDSVQLKEVERSLSNATKNVVSQLEIDERSLSDIQKSRKELERQLQELNSLDEEEEEEREREEEEKQHQHREGKKEGEGGRSPHSTDPLPSASPLPPHFLSRQSSLSRLQTRDELLASSQPLSAVGLHHDRSDLGRKLELYIYRYNCWEEIEVVDYEPTKGLHKCRHLDRTEQWIDLKKKQLRELPSLVQKQSPSS
jgi:hypothetical protein